MFPIIPQFFMDRVIDVETKSNSEMNLSGRITACSVIEKNSYSAEFDANIILNVPETSVHKEIRIFSNRHGEIQSNSKSWSWLKRAHFADDCHSYNVELQPSTTDNLPNSQHFRLKATRRIEADEMIVLWFSHEILIQLQIQHLTLHNIRGEKKYICHKCPYECEMPNPLKIHIALECDRLPKVHLWQRLHRAEFNVDAPLVPLSNALPSVRLAKIVKPKSTRANSAFKPYEKSCTFKIAPDRSTNMEKTTFHSTTSHASVDRDLINTRRNFLYKRAAEMETIVSNLGRFKQGHLCIYCGKIYSRKYGLKIHIRTHTGFKPLKCKFCLRPFGDPSNLNKHIRLHSDGADTPYKCEQCGKILVRKRDLERHMKSRHQFHT